MKRLLLVSCLALMACRGYDGYQGSTGLPGKDGQSVTGPAGSDGTTVTPVQFCPGTPSYPSTFIESGLCINGKIYAVFSSNDGFLTYIPPGGYSSNAINSRCNFTVLPNCGISNY